MDHIKSLKWLGSGAGVSVTGDGVGETAVAVTVVKGGSLRSVLMPFGRFAL